MLEVTQGEDKRLVRSQAAAIGCNSYQVIAIPGETAIITRIYQATCLVLVVPRIF